VFEVGECRKVDSHSPMMLETINACIDCIKRSATSTQIKKVSLKLV